MDKEGRYYKKIVQTGFMITFGYLLMFLLVSTVNRQVKDLRLKHVVRKNIIYVLNVLILLYIFFIWIQNINSLTIFLSVISAGIALALQEALLCIAGWFLIISRRPFEVGDRIEMNGVKGDVIDIRFFQTSLLEIGNWVDADQSTGRIAQVPNSAVFKKEVYNYNRGFEYIWNEIPVLVTFESDWKRAKEIILQHAQKEAETKETMFKRRISQMTKSYMIHFEKLSPIVYVSIKDSGVLLTLRYLTEAKKRRSTEDDLCQAILNDFEREERVNFAYPTYRIVKT
ncbi:MAG: mechanosensitive ion channel family protein [Candidatus Omnitrophica bacterium]|nr:mechanosensitive ion channel family protein [Candidatus Omnitrophota bacterium]